MHEKQDIISLQINSNNSFVEVSAGDSGIKTVVWDVEEKLTKQLKWRK